MIKKIVYFFCINVQIDPVANHIFNYLKEHYLLQETGITCDGYQVLSYTKSDYLFYCVPMDEVLSHNYNKYLKFIKEQFSDCELAAIVNWHEGSNAPDNILTVHSTGDVPTGIFAPSDPAQIKSIFQSIERNRKKFNLLNYRTLIEATHWSGIPYNQNPELILEIDFPMYDIEIGSEKRSWEDPSAIQVLSESLFDLAIPDINFYSFIGVGGKHFEESFSEVLINETIHLVPGHILPNQWIANENYVGEEGKRKLRNCIKSVRGSVAAIIFHDNLKGAYKQLCREVAEEYNIPYFKHKILKSNEQMAEFLKI